MFERYRLWHMAAADAPGGGGTPPSGNGAGNADQINELINIAVGKRVKKAVEKAFESLRGDLASVVKEAISGQSKPTEPKAPVDPPAATPGNPAPGEQDRLTMKTLQEEIRSERKARTELENRLKEEQQRVRDSRMRSEVERRFAAKLGADNPALGLLMDSFFDTRKRVVEQDGQYRVKFKGNADDEDQFRPLDEAVTALFDKGGELHHLVANPSKAQQLPPGGVPRGVNGVPVTIPNGQAGAGRPNPLYQVAASHYAAQGDTDIAQQLATAAAPSPNGTPK